MSTEDPYWKLRPAPPTPIEELCSCADAPPILLRSTLGPNPLACARCNLEVRPEAIALPPDLAEDLASWRAFHDCFYLLWLDSADFEDWAFAQLSNPNSPVNLRGLALRQKLEPSRRAFFWWFQDVGAPDFRPLTQCPLCAAELGDRNLVGPVCDDCSLVVAN